MDFYGYGYSHFITRGPGSSFFYRANAEYIYHYRPKSLEIEALPCSQSPTRYTDIATLNVRSDCVAASSSQLTALIRVILAS